MMTYRFDHLLVRAELLGYCIIVSKPDNLCDVELKLLAIFKEKLLGGKRIRTVCISNKAEIFREFFKVLESHSHGHNAWPHTTVVRYLIPDNDPGCSVHNKPDKAFYSANFYIGLIGSKDLTL